MGPSLAVTGIVSADDTKQPSSAFRCGCAATRHVRFRSSVCRYGSSRKPSGTRHFRSGRSFDAADPCIAHTSDTDALFAAHPCGTRKSLNMNGSGCRAATERLRNTDSAGPDARAPLRLSWYPTPTKPEVARGDKGVGSGPP